MEPIKQFEYCVTNIPSCCVNPDIKWISKPGVEISCSGKCVTVSFPEDYTEKKCVTLLIACNSCGTDQVIERKVCFCGPDGGCGPCQDCNSNGLCVDRCEGICDEETNTCVDCDPDHPCPGGKACIAGKCQCGPNKPYDLGGRCAECLGEGHCEAKYGKCYKCVDGTCVYKGDCGGTGICDPATGNCEECLTKSDCKGDNQCCDDKKCKCCPGFVLNPNTGQCVEGPSCTGNDCGPCGECIQGKCVPRQCPDGQVCVNGACLEKCDCNNPASCSNQGKICKNIEGQCVCVPCGTCDGGCQSGCHCAGNNTCVVDKCHGSCNNGAGCGGGGNGCGCLGEKCVDCSQLKCATGQCAEALGCECNNLGDCVSTANRCVGGCDTKGNCGDGCTCHEQKCVPCEFFSCTTGECATKEGCRCNGSKCEADPDYKCKDKLEIVQIDETCDIEGHLTKERSCTCPVITTLLQVDGGVTSNGPVGVSPNKTSGTHTFKLKASLFLGNTTDAAYLLNNTSNPEISINETANGGSLVLDVITNFQPVNGNIPTPITQSLKASIAEKGVVDMGSLTIYQMNGYPISSGEVNENRIVSSVTFRLRAEGWEFKNTCKYSNKQIGAFEVLNNKTFGGVRITDIISSTQVRNPKMIWYKSTGGQMNESSWIRTVYVDLDASGKYIDRLPNDEVNGIKYEESCYIYGLKSDCSCDSLKSKKIVFCKPTDFTAEIKANSCGKTAVVSIPATCHANKNKDYELLVNGVVKDSFKLYPTSPINNKEYNDLAGIKSIELRMKCNGGYECVKTKTFDPPTAPVIIPGSTCEDQAAGKIKYSFAKGVHTPDFTGVTMKNKANGVVQGSSVEVRDGKTYVVFIVDSLNTDGSVIEYEYEVQFPCGSYKSSIKKNCCKGLKPIFLLYCDKGKVVVGNVQDTVSYYIDFFKISPQNLKSLTNLSGEVSFTTTDGSPVKVTNPKQLTWIGPECQPEILAIPGGTDCCKFSFNAEQSGQTAQLVVNPEDIYPVDADAEYLISVQGGAKLPYVPGTTIPATYGQVKVVLQKQNCQVTQILEVRSYTGSQAPCDIDDNDIIVTQDLDINCKYKVQVPDIDCPCKNGGFSPFITSVTRIGEKVKVDFEGDFYLFEKEVGAGAQPLVKTGVLKVSSGDFLASQVLSNIDRVTGSVEIPCKKSINDSIGYSVSLLKTAGTESSATIKMCVNWPSSNVSVISASIKNNTTSQLISGGYLGGLCWQFTGVNLTGGADLEISLGLSNGSTTKVMAFGVLNPTGSEISSTYGDDESFCADCTTINIWVESCELNDGCKYSNKIGSTEALSSEINVCIDDLPGETMSNNLYPIDGAKRKVQLVYKENGNIIKTQYVNGGNDYGYLDGTLPGNPDGIEYGKSYIVEAKCACGQEKFIDFCLKPKVTGATTECKVGSYYSDGSSALTMQYSVKTCYANKSVSIYRSDGTLIDTATTNSGGEIVDKVIDLTEAMAGLENDFSIYPQFDGGCKGVLSNVVRSEYVPSYTIDCTNSPVSYDIVFVGSPTIHIVSGVGAISGSSIVNIPNNTAISFQATVNSCKSKIYTVTHDCTIVPSVSLTPTPSKSVSKSTPLFSVSRTKSVTPSISTSTNVGGIFIGSVSITPTPSMTKSITPSISVSRSVGASADPTPSVTKSITVSPSASRSIGAPDPSPSLTPSISSSPSEGASVSVTASRTSSITISVTRSISTSSCNGTCPTGFTGQICGGLYSCCNGTLLTAGQSCCNGTVINPGDTCCSYSNVLLS